MPALWLPEPALVIRTAENYHGFNGEELPFPVHLNVLVVILPEEPVRGQLMLITRVMRDIHGVWSEYVSGPSGRFATLI